MNFWRAVLIALAIASPVHAQLVTSWTIEESQLDIPHGGRVNTIAINPTDITEAFATSESGGLFKTIDAGAHWQHVDTLPVIFTQSVAYLPSDPTGQVIFVSAKADFKRENGGGVWRSDNGGDDWTQVWKDSPGAGDDRLSAYEISTYGDIVYVGTSRGLAIGWNGGSVWGDMPVFSSPDRDVFAVLVKDHRIYVGGRPGVRVMNIPAPETTPAWETPMNGPATTPLEDIHAFGGSPIEGHALVLNQYVELYVTTNSGTNWTPLGAPQERAGCSGIAFIKAVEYAGEPVPAPASGRYLKLYYSNRCELYSASAQIDLDGTVHYPRREDDWQEVDVDHGGPRDLGVTGNTPFLLGTSGGLHKEVIGNVWRFAGGGKDGGFNALQINEIKGQNVGGLRTDLYIGTRDNNLWAWSRQDNSLRFRESEGHHIELPRKVESSSDCKMTFSSNGERIKSGRLLANMVPWRDAPAHRREAPALIRESHYIQNVRATNGSPDPGLKLTDDCGDDWDMFAVFGEEPRDLPRLASAGDLINPLSSIVVYQPYRAPGAGGWHEASRLIRIQRLISSDSPANVAYPAMAIVGEAASFVRIGLNPTQAGGYRVYGVDSRDPRHIIAPDVVHARMMRSTDGGESWQQMPELTALVTDPDSMTNLDRLLFRTDLAGPNMGKICPVVTAVSFSPQDPRLVLVGTSEGGIFVSTDRGDTWRKVPQSEHATYVTSFFWENANTVYVSTYGRGLWKLKNRIAVPPPFGGLCPGCDVVSMNPGGDAPRFDRGALVFDGRILAVRTEKSRLREVFVTPGSSVVFIGDLKDLQDDIVITESDERDAAQFEPMPKAPDGWIATGVVFTGDDELTGAVFAEGELSLLPPESKEDFEKGSTDSPTKGMPYVSLSSSAVGPREAFELSATDFVAGATYELLIDEAPVKGSVTADGKGSFTTTITAPLEPGYHSVSVRMAGEETVIDGSTFLVTGGN